MSEFVVKVAGPDTTYTRTVEGDHADYAPRVDENRVIFRILRELEEGGTEIVFQTYADRLIYCAKKQK